MNSAWNSGGTLGGLSSSALEAPLCQGPAEAGAGGLVGAPVGRRGAGTQGPLYSGMGVPPKEVVRGPSGDAGG